LVNHGKHKESVLDFWGPSNRYTGLNNIFYSGLFEHHWKGYTNCFECFIPGVPDNHRIFGLLKEIKALSRRG
jgi:hypothetical protein